MLRAFLEVLGTGLSLWDHHLKYKYVEEFRKHERIINEQEKLPIELRDMPLYQHAIFELRLLGQAFSSQANRASVSNKP